MDESNTLGGSYIVVYPMYRRVRLLLYLKGVINYYFRDHAQCDSHISGWIHPCPILIKSLDKSKVAKGNAQLTPYLPLELFTGNKYN